jgi:hypothetical protein
MKLSQEEIEFYEKQISLMIERYKILFDKNKLSWNNYYTFALKKLNNNLYYVWIFLCGLETFIKGFNFEVKDKNLLAQNLYKDAERRIYRIIGNSKKIDDYINSLG